MAAWSLNYEDVAADAGARRPAPSPVAAWSIRYDEVLPVRSSGRAVLAVRSVSTLYLWIVGTLLVWALAPAVVGLAPVLITSGSMQPAVSSGDVVVMTERVEHPVEAGAVLIFRDPATPGQLVTHRVVDQHEDGTYQTRGDANAAADSSPLPRDHVRGTARILVPTVGLPILWLRSGDMALFTVWTVVTIAALAGVIVPAPPAQRAHRRSSSPSASQARPRGPRRAGWQPGAAVSLFTVTLLTLLPLSVAAFSATTASAGDWTAETLPVPPNLDGTVVCGTTSKDVDLTWDAVASDSGADGYAIYRSATSGGPYDDHRGTVEGTDTTTFSDSDLAIENDTYYYVVRSSDSFSSWESSSSNEYEAPRC